MRIINLVLNTSFFTFYFNYLSYLTFPFIFNEITSPLTITPNSPKRWNQTSELLKPLLALGWQENRLKAGRKPLHWGQFFIFPLSEWWSPSSMSWITICLTREEWRRFLSKSSVVLCRRAMKLSCWPGIMFTNPR